MSAHIGSVPRPSGSLGCQSQSPQGRRKPADSVLACAFGSTDERQQLFPSGQAEQVALLGEVVGVRDGPLDVARVERLEISYDR
jgi:hypothetical protein